MNTLTNLNTFPLGNSLDGVNIITEEINTLSLLVDGTNNMMADLNMDNHIIKNLEAGTDSLDAVNKSQLDTKADTTYVNTQLGLKADKTYVDSSLNSLRLYTDGQDNLKLNKAGDTMTGQLTLNYANSQLNIRATQEDQSSTLFLSTPYNNGDTRKTALIASGIDSFSRANLHFCLNSSANNTTNASVSDSRMCILNGGNVGIGTTTPVQRLDVNGASIFRGSLSMNSTNKITNLANGTNADEAVNLSQLTDLRTYTDASLNLKVNRAGDTITGNLAILQNLSIGTSTISTPLYVVGDGIITGQLYTKGFYTDGRATISEATGTGANASFGSLTLEHRDSGGKSSIVFKSNANVLSDYGYIEYRDNYNTGNTENGALIIGVENDTTGTNEDKIYFKLNGADRIAISGDGKLGINKTSPTEMLDVSGNTIISGKVGIGENSLSNKVTINTNASKTTSLTTNESSVSLRGGSTIYDEYNLTRSLFVAALDVPYIGSSETSVINRRIYVSYVYSAVSMYSSGSGNTININGVNYTSPPALTFTSKKFYIDCSSTVGYYTTTEVSSFPTFSNLDQLCLKSNYGTEPNTEFTGIRFLNTSTDAGFIRVETDRLHNNSVMKFQTRSSNNIIEPLTISSNLNATNPYLVNGVDICSIGYNQTWQNVSREKDVWYENTTGRPICVNANFTGNDSGARSHFGLEISTTDSSLPSPVYIDKDYTGQDSNEFTVRGIIPSSGQTWYRVVRISGGNTTWNIDYWSELR